MPRPELLERYQAIYVNVDSPRAPLTGWLTTGAAYFRLHGRQTWYSYNYSDVELAEIALAARSAAERGAIQVFIYFNNDFEGNAPRNALKLKSLLEE